MVNHSHCTHTEHHCFRSWTCATTAATAITSSQCIPTQVMIPVYCASHQHPLLTFCNSHSSQSHLHDWGQSLFQLGGDDEHGLALTLENTISQLCNIFASARISHISHNFPWVCACTQIEYKSLQLIAFWPLSLHIIISLVLHLCKPMQAQRTIPKTLRSI